jgi:starch synthase (maltosyl-transferring)
VGSPAEKIEKLEYRPASNRNLLQYSILPIRVKVRLVKNEGIGPFQVLIRTNLNQAGRIRRQIIDLVERGQNYSTDFYDIPTTYDTKQDEYRADILLSEAGYFEFKVRVESSRRQEPWVKWAEGPNVGISVRPLAYGRNNSIYCAFLRQYIPDKQKASLADGKLESAIRDLEDKGAYVIPPGGTFENFKEVLPFIIEELGMKIIHLLPINPVPVSYGRMGMYGSPYATTDYFGIDHTLARFSRYKTIEDQFIDLTSSIHGLGAKVFLDMVINHTGWASSINFTHRHWLKVDKEGKILSPGAWDVTWGDLVELDYRHRDLWQYMAMVFLAWCERGIDGFRLDAGYMVPLQVWQYIIAKVRQKFPDTLFLLEGLGGPWETTETLLTMGQMNWAYSELFQNYSRRQIIDYLAYAQKTSNAKGVMVHYVETHDNDRIANKGKAYARMRLYLSALTSFSGAWGFTNGVEWLATEKINVHRNTGLNWGNAENLVEDISRLNRIMAENPAFWECNNLEMIDLEDEDLFAFTRSNADRSNVILGLINLNVEKSKSFRWPLGKCQLGDLLKSETVLYDLGTDQLLAMPAENQLTGNLSRGGCLLYRLQSAERAYRATIPAIYEVNGGRIALIYQILLSRFAAHEAGRIDPEKLLRQVDSCRKLIALVNTTSLVGLIRGDIGRMLQEVQADLVDRYTTTWTFQHRHKQFIVSGDQWLVVRTYLPCTGFLSIGEKTLIADSLLSSDGLTYVLFFAPQPENQSGMLTFNWKISRGRIIERQWQEESYPILSVPSVQKSHRPQKVHPLCLSKPEIMADNNTVLQTNAQGSVCQCPAIPMTLTTKYDSLLSVSGPYSHPGNRVSLVRTIRETVRIGAKYFDLDESFFRQFTRFPQPAWEFVYDDGENYLRLERSLVMSHDEDSVYVRYKLKESNVPIEITCKCYLESRSVHDSLRATEALRTQYEASCHAHTSQPGMSFTPVSGPRVQLSAKHGEFVLQPHWIYQEELPQDAERGLDHTTDMFCPGFFTFRLARRENQVILLSAEKLLPERISVHRETTREHTRIKELLERIPNQSARKDPLVKMLVCALDQFLLYSDAGWQIVAGYPWLGVRTRDALCCVGGLLTVGRYDVAEDIILQSALTEKKGLLADWLRGGPADYTGLEPSLRLFLAVWDYVLYTQADSFWDSLIGDRRGLREVLVDIYESLRDGIDQGPRLDSTSGLLYCPACFNWMNTRDPQVTPRQGYPVEIQALWSRVLTVLPEIYPPYADQARQIQAQLKHNFLPLFWNETDEILADVLLTDGPMPADRAQQDTAIRFNTLSAITAGMAPSEKAQRILDQMATHLLIPGGVRSLAERYVPVPLKIRDRKGQILVDPRNPYRGHCLGNETSRRLSYHNGTAWPYAYCQFVEAMAWVSSFSESAVKQSLAYFEPIRTELMSSGLGTLGEMKDGNFPHTTRGCIAYAYSVAEAVRVYMLLKYPHSYSLKLSKCTSCDSNQMTNDKKI